MVLDDDDGNNPVVQLRRLAVSVEVLQLLIDYGADRSCKMVGRVSKDWNLVQILASMSQVLHRVTIDQAFVPPVSRGVSRGVSVVVVAVFCWGTTGGGVGIIQF